MSNLLSSTQKLKNTLQSYCGTKTFKGGLITPNILISGLSIEDYENLIESKTGVEIALFPISEFVVREYFGGIQLGFNILVLVSNYSLDASLTDPLKLDIITQRLPLCYNVGNYQTKPLVSENIIERSLFDLNVLEETK